MARPLKQSTSVDVPIGPFLDATDGITAETGLTITQPDVRLKKNGGAWAQKAAAQTLSHEENGFYEVTLDATDTDTLGLLRLAVFESGACPVWEDFIVLSANNYDSAVAASDFIQVDVAQFGGTNLTASAGRPEVNASHVGGTQQTARDLGATLGAAGAGLTAVPWNASWDAEVQSEVDDAIAATIADSVPADGSRPSVKQALLMITRFLMERSVSGTTVTVAKEDGTTASMTFTLDDGTSPTSITRAS